MLCICSGFLNFYRPLLPALHDKRSAWLQVGRSYQGVEDVNRSDQDPKGLKQASSIPPRDEAQQERVMDATSGAGMTKRPKAADFFGVPVDSQNADVHVDDAAISISRRRHSYPSDDDHSDKKANSDLHVREGRLKTGKLRSTTQDNYRCGETGPTQTLFLNCLRCLYIGFMLTNAA